MRYHNHHDLVRIHHVKVEKKPVPHNRMLDDAAIAVGRSGYRLHTVVKIMYPSFDSKAFKSV